jgi:hypothetical protein
MTNLEDLLETSSVKEPKPKYLPEYRLPGQNDMITIDIRSAPPDQVAEWFDTHSPIKRRELSLKNIHDLFKDLKRGIDWINIFPRNELPFGHLIIRGCLKYLNL